MSVKKVFLGEYRHTVDRQRRLAMPSDWRSGGDTPTVFYLVPGPNEVIMALPEKIFEKLVYGNAAEVSFADAENIEALADLGSVAQRCKCDTQGRISLTPDLMACANLEISGMALLKGSVTMIRISRLPEQESPLKERVEKFLVRMRELHKSTEVFRHGTGG